MSALKASVLLATLGLACFQLLMTPSMAQSTGAVGVGTRPTTARLAPSTVEPPAPALPPAPRTRKPGWVQREGYVPVPESLLRKDEPPAADPNALPPANSWGNFATTDAEKPFANDPTGTSVFAESKYAPANVRAAIDAQQTPEFDAPMPSAGGFVGGGMGGNSNQVMQLQQSFDPSAPVAAAPASDGVFAGGNNNAFNNRYTPSVGNAMGSSDLLVQMILDASEQDAARRTDALRQMMGQISNTPPARIFVYQTRTINNPTGQPSTAISFLLKNNVDAERARQQSVFGSADMMRGFIDDVARGAKLKIAPGSIKVSSAVNDGGVSAGAGAMPGQMPGQMGMMPGANGMMMPQAGMPGATGAQAAQAPTAPPAAAPAKSSAAGAAAGVLTAAAMALTVLAVL